MTMTNFSANIDRIIFSESMNGTFGEKVLKAKVAKAHFGIELTPYIG